MAEKKFIIDNAKLMAEWDWEKNNAIGFDPQKISVGSQKVAFWICSIHKTKFKQIIRARERGQRGCPHCFDEWKTSISRERYINNKKVLAETHPELVAEWVSCDNPKFTPQTCVAGSNVKVKWRCQKCGGEYEAYIANRTLRGSSCPYCANQKVLVGYNDLLSQYPELAEEWSDKNTISSTDVTPHSNKKVYWICPLGHEDYLMSIKQRSNRQGCPICAQQSQTSFPEQAIFFYLKMVFPDAINRYVYNNKEIDIYLPSKHIGIEYNGYFSHKDKAKKDEEKKSFFRSLGITIITVKEYKHIEEKINADFYIHERVSRNDLNILITNLLHFLCEETLVDVNCERDTIAIKEQYIVQRKENSIKRMRPDLVKEWDCKRNGKITPDLVSFGSNAIFYWICSNCGNSFKASPKNRSYGKGCFICSQRIIKSGVNDVASVYPNLAAEWDFTKNPNSPSHSIAKKASKYYWICELGHSYAATIQSRLKGQSCSVCNGKKVLAGFNDLLSQNPELAKEWDYELNDCVPSEIHFGNQSKNIHWICKTCGHKWESKVKQRKNCPECKKKRLQINVYDAKNKSFLYSFTNTKELCAFFDLDVNKQRGNISMICSRQQKTLMGKYILRHANDDEFSEK